MKIDKKFQEELKLANLEKEELIVNLDESDKKNEFLRNRFSKSLEKELVESKAELKSPTLTLLPSDLYTGFEAALKAQIKL